MRRHDHTPPPVGATREEQIIRLREKGSLSNREIAQALGLAVHTVETTASTLIRKGRLQPRRRGRSPLPGAVRHERAQTIIPMVQRKAMLEEIGGALGVTKERARQLIEQVADEHGEAVFATNDPLYTTSEAAETLGVDRKLVASLCDRGEIPWQRRGERQRMITKATLETLKRHPAITGERACAVCGTVFVYAVGQGRRTACSDPCHEEQRRRRQAAYADEKPTLGSLGGWLRDVWQKLKSRTPPTNEEWITIREAIARTGLSKMQIVWLHHRHIVRGRPHPTKKWRGQPVRTCEASEVKIAGRVYAAHLRRTGTR